MTVDQQTQVPTTTQLSVRRNALTGRYRYYRVPDAPLNSKLAHLQQNFSIVEPSQVPPDEAEVFWSTTVDDPKLTPFTSDAAAHRLDFYIDTLERVALSNLHYSHALVVEKARRSSVGAEFTAFNSPAPEVQLAHVQGKRWEESHASDYLSDILVAELVDGRRILLNNDHWVAFVPYAPSAAFEVMVLPKRPAHNIVALTDSMRASLEHTYRQITELVLNVLGAQTQVDFRWVMTPVAHQTSLSRMWLQCTANQQLGNSPEELAQILKAYL